jgi:exodeoxyribonuclease VII small subunit
MAIADESLPTPDPSVPNGATFEAAYRELQDVISRLDVGGLGLEESLRLYERGVELARVCEAIVARAELRVTRLQADDSLPGAEPLTTVGHDLAF